MIDIEIVKARIAAREEDFIRELFGDRAKRAGEGKWRIGSHGSLAIELKDGGLVYCSHEDGTGGDCIALWQRERGGNNGDVLRACAAWAGFGESAAPIPLRTYRPPTTPAPLPADELPYTLNAQEIASAITMARRLYEDAGLRERIATARGWKPETLRLLTLEPSIGWHDDHEGGKLAFLYESGVKLRWRHNGERRFGWHFGKPWLWRGGYLAVPAWSRVILAEGETDGIRLIDAGAEEDGKTLVVALASASTFAPAWAQRFRGKDVILALDNDEAGQRATERIGGFLRHSARTVGVLNWKEVACEAA